MAAIVYVPGFGGTLLTVRAGHEKERETFEDKLLVSRIKIR